MAFDPIFDPAYEEIIEILRQDEAEQEAAFRAEIIEILIEDEAKQLALMNSDLLQRQRINNAELANIVELPSNV